MTKFNMNPIFEAMSAMQKYIRRSQPKEAFYFAMKLCEFNPVMMWNRLQEIVSEDIGIVNPNLVVTFEILRKWYYQKMDQKKNGTLYLAHAILLMCQSPKSRDATNLLFNVLYPMEFEGMKYPIPDFAYDRHTAKGKRKGRGWEHFFEEGCKLDPDQSNKEWAIETQRLVEKYDTTTEISSENKVKNAWRRLRPANKKTQLGIASFGT